MTSSPSSAYTPAVIHVITDPDACVREIPVLLAGQTPAEHDSNFGSQNYSTAPVAVALGGGYDDATFARIQDACKDVRAVPWFRPDMSRMGEMPALDDVEAYGKATAARFKKTLQELKVGEEGGKADGVHLY